MKKFREILFMTFIWPIAIFCLVVSLVCILIDFIAWESRGDLSKPCINRWFRIIDKWFNENSVEDKLW